MSTYHQELLLLELVQARDRLFKLELELERKLTELKHTREYFRERISPVLEALAINISNLERLILTESPKRHK